MTSFLGIFQQGIIACLMYFQDLVEKSVRGTLPASMSGCVRLRPATDSPSKTIRQTTPTDHVTYLRSNDLRSKTEQTSPTDRVNCHTNDALSLADELRAASAAADALVTRL